MSAMDLEEMLIIHKASFDCNMLLAKRMRSDRRPGETLRDASRAYSDILVEANRKLWDLSRRRAAVAMLAEA